jgi:hypothetical protein
MHDQFVTGLARRSRNAFEERHREFRRRAKRAIVNNIVEQGHRAFKSLPFPTTIRF